MPTMTSFGCFKADDTSYTNVSSNDAGEGSRGPSSISSYLLPPTAAFDNPWRRRSACSDSAAPKFLLRDHSLNALREKYIYLEDESNPGSTKLTAKVFPRYGKRPRHKNKSKPSLPSLSLSTSVPKYQSVPVNLTTGEFVNEAGGYYNAPFDDVSLHRPNSTEGCIDSEPSKSSRHYFKQTLPTSKTYPNSSVARQVGLKMRQSSDTELDDSYFQSDNQSHGSIASTINTVSRTVDLNSSLRSVKQKIEDDNMVHLLTSKDLKPPKTTSTERIDIIDTTTQPPAEAENVVTTKLQKCGYCCKHFLAFLFSTVGLTMLLVGYVIVGGFIFQGLESSNERQMNEEMMKVRKAHIESLWQLTVDLNVLHPSNWSALAEDILTNYTKIVYHFTKKKGWDGNDQDQEMQWSFAGALLYSITVITTIGYGHIAPKTDWGRIVTMLYAIIGIPLTLLTITNLGSFMATAFRFLYRNIICGLCCPCCYEPTPSDQNFRRRGRSRKRKQDKNQNDSKSCDDLDKNFLSSKEEEWNEQISLSKEQNKNRTSASADRYKANGQAGQAKRSKSAPGGGRDRVRNEMKSEIIRIRKNRIQSIFATEELKTVTVPIYVSLLLIVGYIALGAMLFTLWEQEWNYLIGCYFCFITLSTIGFGDYVPGTSLDAWDSQEKLVLCALYLLIGLALIAMCFDLMQEQARATFKELGRKLGLIE